MKSEVRTTNCDLSFFIGHWSFVIFFCVSTSRNLVRACFCNGSRAQVLGDLEGSPASLAGSPLMLRCCRVFQQHSLTPLMVIAFIPLYGLLVDLRGLCIHDSAQRFDEHFIPSMLQRFTSELIGVT